MLGRHLGQVPLHYWPFTIEVAQKPNACELAGRDACPTPGGPALRIRGTGSVMSAVPHARDELGVLLGALPLARRPGLCVCRPWRGLTATALGASRHVLSPDRDGICIAGGVEPPEHSSAPSCRARPASGMGGIALPPTRSPHVGQGHPPMFQTRAGRRAAGAFRCATFKCNLEAPRPPAITAGQTGVPEAPSLRKPCLSDSIGQNGFVSQCGV